MPERYVRQRELAELMGVSVRTIKRWTTDGMPSETWGIRVRRYLPSKCMAWTQQHAASTLESTDNPPARCLTSTGVEHREE